MPKEVTDPNLIKQFDAAQGQGKEVTDPNVIKQFNRGPDPVGDYARRGWEYAAPVVKGAAKSGANTLDEVFRAGDWMKERVGGHGLPLLFSWPAKLSDVVSQHTREQVKEFANQPMEPGAERSGYVGGEALKYAGGGTALFGPKAIGAGAKFLVKEGLTYGVGEGLSYLSAFPGGGLLALALKHGYGLARSASDKRLLDAIAKRMMKEAPEAFGKEAAPIAEKAVPQGLPSPRPGAGTPPPPRPPRTSPGWTPEKEAELNRRFPKVQDLPPPKPRVRVPAGSREVPDTND